MATITIELDVKQFVEEHNNKNVTDPITRYDVYNMIKEGKLNAHRGEKNKWIIELTIKEPKKTKKTKEYSVKEFVEAYNGKHPKCPITVEEARKMLTDGILKGEKVNRKWVVYTSPTRKVK